MGHTHLIRALERACQEGRNVVPNATDDEARLIELFAAHLLVAVEMDDEAESDRNRDAAEARFMDRFGG